MEKRQVTQVRVHKLVCNSVFERFEHGQIVAVSTSPEALEAWYKAQFAEERYTEPDGDRQLSLVFKPESPLHYFNPVNSLIPDDPNNHYHGVYSEWVNEDILAHLDTSSFVWVPENE